jgi:hypothetical protein
MTLPAGIYSPFSMSLKDRSKEIGVFSIYGKLLDAENFDANQTLATDFVGALNGITLGVIVETTYGIQTIINPVGYPGSSSAQRENKVLVRYYDDTTFEKLTASIPTVDVPNLYFETDARDYVSKTGWAGSNTGSNAMTVFVAAWLAFVANPRTNNLTLIDSLEFVGRNT